MMVFSLYCIRDTKVGVFMSPFPSRGDEHAIRQVRDSLLDSGLQDTPIVLHPADFDLMYVGDFDDTTGYIVPFSGGSRGVCNLASLATSTVSS